MRFPYMQGRGDNLGFMESEGRDHQPAKPLAFSPELSLMLSMVLKDNPGNERTMDMLKSIMPYVNAKDKGAIRKLLDYGEYEQNSANKFNTRNQKHEQPDYMSLINMLKNYGDKSSAPMFEGMMSAFGMQNNMNDIFKKISKFQNMQNMDMGSMFEMLSMFMPKNSNFSNISNMSNMMSMFSGMKNIDPSMLMNMMGGFGN